MLLMNGSPRKAGGLNHHMVQGSTRNSENMMNQKRFLMNPKTEHSQTCVLDLGLFQPCWTHLQATSPALLKPLLLPNSLNLPGGDWLGYCEFHCQAFCSALDCKGESACFESHPLLPRQLGLNDPCRSLPAWNTVGSVNSQSSPLPATAPAPSP